MIVMLLNGGETIHRCIAICRKAICVSIHVVPYRYFERFYSDSGFCVRYIHLSCLQNDIFKAFRFITNRCASYKILSLTAMADKVVGIYSPPSGKNTSAVWEYFGHPIFMQENNVRKTDKSQVIFKLCKTQLRHSGNTTNIKTHLQRHHPTHSKAKQDEATDETCFVKKEPVQTICTIQNEKKASQQTIEDCLKKQEKYPINSPRAQAITRQIGVFLCQDPHPLCTIERPGFIQLMNVLDLKYNVPSRTHFAKTVIPKLYCETKATVEKELKEADTVAITTDSWPRGYKTFFMLSSAETKIYPAHKC